MPERAIKDAAEGSEPQLFGERIYRSIPAPLISYLLNKRGVGHPSAVIESIEGSTAIPAFEPEEFEELMLDMREMADDATQRLLELRDGPK